MDTKIIILAVISYIHADHLNTDLLPPANVANIFHESGITFVSPLGRHLEISSSLLAPPLPVTHAYVDLSHNSNLPQGVIRTHSFQPLPHELRSSISTFHSPNGIQPNTDGLILIDKHRDDDHQTAHDVHIDSTDVVQARFEEHENHGVHEINSRTQHFEYKVPLTRTAPTEHVQHNEHIPHRAHHHDDTEFTQRITIAKHSTYGVPTFVPSQDEINSLPVFQNYKFLSPAVRHTNTPTHHNINPTTQSIESIFDPSFDSNKSPNVHTRVNDFEPTIIHSNARPTTHTRENIIEGENQYTNRFSLSDGTKVSEQGKLISTEQLENVIAKSGEYEYISPEGTPIKVKWVADHRGFRVVM